MANLVLLLQTLLNKIAAESGLSIPAGQVPYILAESIKSIVLDDFETMTVLRIHEIWCGYGSGSADPCLRPMDPDPAIFVIDLQDANKKLIKKSFSAYYFLMVHLHHFSKIKRQKECTKQ